MYSSIKYYLSMLILRLFGYALSMFKRPGLALGHIGIVPIATFP